MIKLNVQRLTDTAKMPERAFPYDAGFDLFADEPVFIGPGEWQIVSTGIKVVPEFDHFYDNAPIEDGEFVRFDDELFDFIEEHYLIELQVRPRSGLAAKRGITVLNTPGTVDEGYRGEIKVILFNSNSSKFIVDAGTKIAQLVPSLVPRTRIQEVGEITFDSLTTNHRTDKEKIARGAAGFGSTGQ